MMLLYRCSVLYTDADTDAYTNNGNDQQSNGERVSGLVASMKTTKRFLSTRTFLVYCE
jgi:hypothetical protein